MINTEWVWEVITTSVHDKFNCVTVIYDKTQHSIYTIKIWTKRGKDLWKDLENVWCVLKGLVKNRKEFKKDRDRERPRETETVTEWDRQTDWDRERERERT